METAQPVLQVGDVANAVDVFPGFRAMTYGPLRPQGSGFRPARQRVPSRPWGRSPNAPAVISRIGAATRQDFLPRKSGRAGLSNATANSSNVGLILLWLQGQNDAESGIRAILPLSAMRSVVTRSLPFRRAPVRCPTAVGLVQFGVLDIQQRCTFPVTTCAKNQAVLQGLMGAGVPTSASRGRWQGVR